MIPSIPSRTSDKRGIWRGSVVEVLSVGVMIEIPRLALGHRYGPCEVPVGMTLAVGSRVAIGFVEGDSADPIILSKLAPL